jgi:hypothetical protein
MHEQIRIFNMRNAVTIIHLRECLRCGLRMLPVAWPW